MLNVMIECSTQPEGKCLNNIPNGTIFTGLMKGGLKEGLYIKTGSFTQATWVIANLRCMEGMVWVSRRDDAETISNYQVLDVKEIVLR